MCGHRNRSGDRFRFGGLSRHHDWYISRMQEAIRDGSDVMPTPPAVTLVSDNDRDVAEAFGNISQSAGGAIVDQHRVDRCARRIRGCDPFAFEHSLVLSANGVQIDQDRGREKWAEGRKGVNRGDLSPICLGHGPGECQLRSRGSINSNDSVM
jgi:hypothetical protein